MYDKDWIKIRVKLGVNELEIEGNIGDVRNILNDLLPIIKEEQSQLIETKPKGEEMESSIVLPAIKVSEKEPVSEILMKLFNTSWARTPRTLSEVIDALKNIGLYYQKSTIAVNLKRLVQRGKLRRIKDKDGIFRYVPVLPPKEVNMAES